MPKSLPDASISFPMLGDWSIDPKPYISIGDFRIYWYAIIIAAGFLLAVLYACKRAEEWGMTSDNILDAILIGVPLSIICARLYYVAFEWEHYAGDFGKIIAIRDGGLAIYGVIIGAILAMFIFCKWKKIPLVVLMDLVCIAFLIGQFIGRWGNFMNREAFGGETDIFCRMVLTTPYGESYSVHPTFLYESLWNFVGFLVIHKLSKKRKYDGQCILMYFCWYGFGRMLVEGLRTDSLMIPHTDIRVSQLISFLLFMMCGALLIYFHVKKKGGEDTLYVNRQKALIEGPAEDGGEDSDGETSDEDETAEEAPEEEETSEEEKSDEEKSDDEKPEEESNEEETSEEEVTEEEVTGEEVTGEEVTEEEVTEEEVTEEEVTEEEVTDEEVTEEEVTEEEVTDEEDSGEEKSDEEKSEEETSENENSEQKEGE